MQDNNKLIQILPLPNGSLLTSNNTTVSGMTNYDIPSYTPNGNYIVTASSSAGDDNAPYKVFNDSITDFWQCDYKDNPGFNALKMSYPRYVSDPYNAANPSSYQGGGDPKNTWITKTGTGSTKVDLKGEWIQIELPYKIYLYKYSIATPVYSTENSTFPLQFTLVGSNDGNEWAYVDQRNLKPDKLPPKTEPKKVFNINSSEKYSYYRLVINQMHETMTSVRIYQWNLFGVTYTTVNPDTKQETFVNLTRGIESGCRINGNNMNSNIINPVDQSPTTIVSRTHQTTREEQDNEPVFDAGLIPGILAITILIYGTIRILYSKK